MDKMIILVAILSIIVVAKQIWPDYPHRASLAVCGPRPIIVHFDQVRIRQYPN